MIADGGAAARLLHRTIVEAGLGEDVTRAADLWLEVTQAVAARALAGDVEGMLRHAADYLQATSILVVAWTLGLQVQGAERAVAAGRRDARLLRGQRAASAYWRRTVFGGGYGKHFR